MMNSRLLSYSLLVGGLLLARTQQARAQADEGWYQAAQRHNAQQKAPASQLRVSSTASTLGTTVSACDLSVNGDFETQLATPSHVNNMGGDYTGTNRPDQLSNWYSPTAGSPDYFGTNATATSDVQPANESSPYASFTPFVTTSSDPVKGAIGLYARQAYTEVNTGISRDKTTEYAQVALPSPLSNARYYADFQVSLSHLTQYSKATNYGIQNGFGLVFTTAANTPAVTNSSRGFITLTGPRVLSGAVNQSAINYGTTGAANWQRVSGQFTGNGEQFLTVGLFNADASNLTLLPGGQSDLLNTYFFVDAVRVFKIPTAGASPAAICRGAAVTLGEGCAISGASYTWSTPSAGSFASSTTAIQTTVSPITTTTYTLTVTLPDGSTYASTSTVTVTSPPVISYGLDFNTDNTCGDKIVRVRVSDQDRANNPGATFELTATGSNYVLTYNSATDHSSCNIRIRNQSVFNIVATGTNYCSTGPAYDTGTFTGPDFLTGCPGYGPQAAPTAYPNPATESLTIPVGVERATLLNAQGQQVDLKPDATGKINVQSLPNGLYNLRTWQGDKPINQHIEIKH